MIHVAVLTAIFQQTAVPVSTGAPARPFYAQAWFWAIVVTLVFTMGCWFLGRFYLWLRAESESLEQLRGNLGMLYEQRQFWSERANEVILEDVSQNSLQRRIVELAHTARKRGASFDAQLARELVESEISGRI